MRSPFSRPMSEFRCRYPWQGQRRYNMSRVLWVELATSHLLLCAGHGRKGEFDCEDGFGSWNARQKRSTSEISLRYPYIVKQKRRGELKYHQLTDTVLTCNQILFKETHKNPSDFITASPSPKSSKTRRVLTYSRSSWKWPPPGFENSGRNWS